MRVLHLHSGNLFGGVETLLLTLARNAGRASGVEMDFGLAFDDRLGRDLRAIGARVEMLGAVRASRPTTVWRARRALRALLVREEHQVVVCHSPWAVAALGPAVRAAGVPLALWLHDAVRGRHWVNRWARLTPPDLVICNSGYTQGTLENLFPDVRSTVLYCPVDPHPGTAIEGRQRVRAELATAEDSVVVIQVGRLEEYKGHVAHLRALARMDTAAPWVLWIVGGAQRPQEERYLTLLREMAEELGIAERVRFVGQRADVPSVLGAADVYCQPNALPEPFGIAIVEALYAGLPVVTTAFGGAAEILTEQCGVLVEPGNIDGLAAALADVIGSAELRSRLGSAGPARAAEISDPARVLSAFASIIGSLGTGMERRAPRGRVRSHGVDGPSRAR